MEPGWLTHHFRQPHSRALLRFGLHTFPSAIKEAMDLAGLPAGLCRKPVGRMPPQARAELALVLDRLREANYLPEVSCASRA
jgi:dihydrodipicolinate synthase/N-acetylneuraminate lyase